MGVCVVKRVLGVEGRGCSEYKVGLGGVRTRWGKRGVNMYARPVGAF